LPSWTYMFESSRFGIVIIIQINIHLLTEEIY
jgi:hypothetical protein